MACPPPEVDWSSWATWSCLREDIAPIATFIGAALVAWAALAQARTARRRHEERTAADRERRITESFAKAVEQLGSDKLEIRLGAIYTLERISQESDSEYWPIMETLTAHVRARTLGGVSHEQGFGIAAALTVLKRRKQSQDQGPLNLRGADLSHADLTNAPFEGANLQLAKLVGADLTRANLQGANLQRAYLGAADLRRAILTGADLRGADLQGKGTTSPPARNLTQEQLNSVTGNADTRLPVGLERPAHWSAPTPEEPPK